MVFLGIVFPILIVVANTLVMGCSAGEQDVLFTWSFANNEHPNLLECGSVGIAVRGQGTRSSVGTPPYYLIAYELYGMATVSDIGSDAANLTWLVSHRAGTDVLVSVVDSEGRSGGVSSVLSIQAGSSSSCLPAIPATFPLVSINVTRDLGVCQPLGMRINDGVPPYTISVAEAGAFTTNFTLGLQDTTFTYVNTATSDTDIFVSVSDTNGVWARQTLSVHTIGSSNTRCGDLMSATGNGEGISSRVLADDATVAGATSTPSQPSGKHTALIVGVCVGIAALVLILCFSAYVYFMRGRGGWPFRGHADGQDTAPRAWSRGGDTTLVESIASNFVSPLKNKRSEDFVKMKSQDSPRSPLESIDIALHPPTSPYATDETHTTSTVSYPPRLHLNIDVLDISPANNPRPSPSPCSVEDPSKCPLTKSEQSRPSAGALPPTSSIASTPIRPLPIPPTTHRQPTPGPSGASPLSLTKSRPLPPTPSQMTPVSPLSPHNGRYRDMATPASATSSHPSHPRNDHRPLRLHAYEPEQDYGRLRTYRSTPNVRHPDTTHVASPIDSLNSQTRSHDHNPSEEGPSALMQGADGRMVIRSRSLAALRAYEEGTVNGTFTEDRRGRNLVILQHRDAPISRTVVQELPPPYHELSFEHLPGQFNGNLGGRL